MESTPATPTIYELNTPVFLREVSIRVGHPVTLANVPDSEWDTIARPGIDMVWFMGVWKRSQIAKDMAKSEPWLKEALPDMTDDDLLGSAYSIQDYVVDEALGGNEGLAVVRAKLKERGIRIMLDYVPNHVAIDHPWVTEHPEYFLVGTEQELAEHPEAFVQTPGGIFAKGKDPNYDPWSDVLQLNAFSPPHRQQAAHTLQSIAEMCDGVRCDMAMLMMNDIFRQTWADQAGEVPSDEYWPAIIASVRQIVPQFVFLAEVYWDKQAALIEQGFDLCYDKDLYDHLVDGSVEGIKKQLEKPVSYQQHLLRFIENHDEERAARMFPFEKHIAAAVITATLPGARLYYDGEREGRQVKLPVHLGRRVEEDADKRVSELYDRLWAFLAEKKIMQGTYRTIKPTTGIWRRESQQVVAWRRATETNRFVIAVNYSSEPARVHLNFPLSKIRSAQEIIRGAVDVPEYINGSMVKLEPWQHVIFDL